MTKPARYCARKMLEKRSLRKTSEAQSLQPGKAFTMNIDQYLIDSQSHYILILSSELIIFLLS